MDSRHNRHMPIRNPRYIIEAQQEAAKKIINRKSLRQCNLEDESIIQKDECFESEINVSNILPMEATIVTAPSAEQDDDCIVVSYSKNRELTEDDVAKQTEFLDNSVAPLYVVKDNVLPIDSKINDESLDLLLRVIRDDSHFETQSVLYLEYPHIIVASRSDKSLQIIGGNCSDHWRCIYFEGTKLRVYDSLPGCTYDKLVPKEKNYIHRRYPQINKNNIIFEKVQAQPDSISCGIYAAAFATTIALGGNPCKEKYSTNVKYMRQHFFKIVAENRLLPFPK